jgi:hypothetical protein
LCMPSGSTKFWEFGEWWSTFWFLQKGTAPWS